MRQELGARTKKWKDPGGQVFLQNNDKHTQLLPLHAFHDNIELYMFTFFKYLRKK